MIAVATLTFHEARDCVARQVRSHAPPPAVETVEFFHALGRVLTEDVAADRDYPPTARSVRDGFALRSSDNPQGLRVIGEVRAGESFSGQIGPGEAVEIMTGAPIPCGADAVVMVEHVSRDGDRISTDKPIAAGDAINLQGCEARRGDLVLKRGQRVGYAEIAMLATVGRTRVNVFARPQVAIVATGDEIVEVAETPREYQVRNSNAQSLAIQVARAGGVPNILPVARDNSESTQQALAAGLSHDLLLLSGGVSAGKYDLVERELASLDAEFFFDRVLIQPGQPLVFGRARGKFFFGLPGNPASTMVTFELFARLAIELLGGEVDPILPLAWARLTQPFRHRTGLTRFLPAKLSGTGELTPVRWAGSSDVAALSRANAYLVTEPERESWEAGDLIRVLMK
jgi:molybdopterin molybdotransferase